MNLKALYHFSRFSNNIKNHRGIHLNNYHNSVQKAGHHKENITGNDYSNEMC